MDMLEELPATIVKRVLQNSSPDTRQLINQFLNYPENSAGSVMTAEYVGLKKAMTVEEAFAYIRKYGVDKETIYTCYVMDAARASGGCRHGKGSADESLDHDPSGDYGHPCDEGCHHGGSGGRGGHVQ